MEGLPFTFGQWSPLYNNDAAPLRKPNSVTVVGLYAYVVIVSE